MSNPICKKIDIRSLKEIVLKECAPDSLLRQVLLIDDDRVPIDQYIGRAMLWVKLARAESK